MAEGAVVSIWSKKDDHVMRRMMGVIIYLYLGTTLFYTLIIDADGVDSHDSWLIPYHRRLNATARSRGISKEAARSLNLLF